MNQESWAHILTIVGSVLLSVELFKSPMEERDEAIGWWGGNPFHTTIRKVIGFVGLLLIILGFAMSLEQSLDSGVVARTASLWFVAAITLAAGLVVFAAYLVVGPWYARRRRRHFAGIVLDLLNQYRTGRLNPVQLYNSLIRHVADLPAPYGELLTTLYSEKTLLENLVNADGQMPMSERGRFTGAVVIRKKDSFDQELEELSEYLRQFRGDSAARTMGTG